MDAARHGRECDVSGQQLWDALRAARSEKARAAEHRAQLRQREFEERLGMSLGDLLYSLARNDWSMGQYHNLRCYLVRTCPCTVALHES